MLTAQAPAPERPAPRGAPGRPQAKPTWGWSPGEGTATAALAAFTMASASGLDRVFTGSAWVGTVMGTAAVTHLALWSMRRRRWPQGAAAPLAAAVVVLMVLWTVFAKTTFYGLPGAATWSQVATSLHRLGSQVAGSVAPLAPSRAMEAVAAAGAGVVAIAGDWFAFRWRFPLMALLPGVGAFVACAVSGRGGREATVGLEVGAACLFLVAEKAASFSSQTWFAGRAAGGWAWRAGVPPAALAVAAALALTPVLAPVDGQGALGWRSPGGTGGGQRIVPNPIVSLRTRLIQLQNTPVFAVDTGVPSYWRLTSLDHFNGETWTSSGSYQGFRSALPGVAHVPAGTRTVRASFQIQGLDSVWLPDQFNPVSVVGAPGVSYDPLSDSLITSKPTSNGMHYTVTSYQYLSTLNAAELQSASPLDAPAGDLQLPAGLGAQIVALAQAVTRGRGGEYAKALALQDYLRSRPFSYSLDPPADGTGIATLYNFLFVTHEGYCQQFAGAYAVLARAAGLPTRLAVGFTTGVPYPGGYQVYDRDAHTWPEVWFGPRFGWVPFEPTPGFSIPGTTAYAGTGSAGAETAPAQTPSTVPGTAPPTSTLHKGVTTPTTAAPAHLASPRRSAPTSVSLWWLAAPVVAVVLAGSGASARTLRRRRRLRRAARAGPGAQVLEVWDQLRADLAREGLRRKPAETDDEFALRAGRWLEERLLRGPWAYGGMPALAGLARRAAFAPFTPPEAAREATLAADEVRRRLHAVQSRAHRFRRSLPLAGLR